MPAKILRVATLTLLAFGVGATAARAGCGNGDERNGCIVIYRGDERAQPPAPRNFNIRERRSQRDRRTDPPSRASIAVN
jgi:hypothetical protein